MKKLKSVLIGVQVLLLAFTLISCGDDEQTPEEVVDAFTGCCSSDTAFGENVDNLDQSLGEIIVDNIFTPNNDGVNDRFEIKNIELYANHTVTIYNNTDEIIFESNNYGSDSTELFPNVPYDFNGVEGIPDGTYKYKIIIENEQTFIESGFFCLFTNNPPIEQNFAECNPIQPGEFDQILTGL
ncbi:T9SS type B sorting domain-containing protein [Winogradskyella vidalii]|uniref:T9SS type B sorting domain-containing protein n=1 Tax=Winogradskyella vidalii TaxID=2615024 RepID=UPI0015C69E76|nr:gliding motility-associated C-terminal domain-containing protein [Winogradskyella vidalii]